MAEWNEKNKYTANKDDWEWDCGIGPMDLWKSFGSRSPMSFSEFDIWERSLFKPQSSALSAGLFGSGHHSEISTSQRRIKQSDLSGIQRCQSASRLAPEGASGSQSPQEFELQAAMKERKMHKTDFIQKLREVRGCLDAQTGLLKTKESQLQQCQSTELLELRQKQLKKTPNALEQQKKTTDESHHIAELQDKVLQLEMDILKSKSSLEARNITQASQSNVQLNNFMPMAKDNFSKENQQKVLNQMEVIKQRLRMSKHALNELQDQLSAAHGQLGQMELEKDNASTKALQLEDNVENLKVKLSSTLSDKERLQQEKAELHQKLKCLELQLNRAQLDKEGFTQQVCELLSDLAQAKILSSQHQQSVTLMKEKLYSVKQGNENLSTELTKVTEKLQLTLQQLHELEAEKLIQTNQITALEAERLQLISEKEELMDVFDPGNQDEIRKLKEQCSQLKKFQNILENEKTELETHCHGLGKQVQNVEAAYRLKEQEFNHLKEKTEQEKEELMKVAAHWNERWLDVAMTLQSTQSQLEEAKKLQQDSSAVIRQSCEIHRLEQLAEKNQELKERDLAFKDLMKQDLDNQAQKKIPTEKNELFRNSDMDAAEKLKSSTNIQSDETRREAVYPQEGQQNVLSFEHAQTTKEERDSPVLNKKEKSDIIDPNQQKKLITEQLKILFKEKEQMGDKMVPVKQRKAATIMDQSSKSLEINQQDCNHNSHASKEEGEHADSQELLHLKRTIP